MKSDSTETAPKRLEFTFAETKSKNYAAACALAGVPPGVGSPHQAAFSLPSETRQAFRLFNFVRRWKGASATLDGASIEWPSVRALLRGQHTTVMIGDGFEQEARHFEHILDLIAAPRSEPIRPKRSRIRGPGAQRPREVDGFFTKKVGSSEIRAIMECRDRLGNQDVLWVEQVATKRTSVGAHLAILISASGFSEEARRLARHHNLELRVVADVFDPTVQERWLLPRISLTVMSAQLRALTLRTELGEMTFKDTQLEAEDLVLGEERIQLCSNALWNHVLNQNQGKELATLVRADWAPQKVHAIQKLQPNNLRLRVSGRIFDCLEAARFDVVVRCQTVKPAGVDLRSYQDDLRQNELLLALQYHFETQQGSTTYAFHKHNNGLGPISINNPIPGSFLSFTTPPSEPN